MQSKGDSRVVAIEPLILDTDGKDYPFTADRIKTMVLTLSQDVPRDRVKVAQLKKQADALEAEIHRALWHFAANGAEAIAKAAALDSLHGQLAAVARSHDKLVQLIPVLERRLAVLPSLVDLGNKCIIQRTCTFAFLLHLLDARSIYSKLNLSHLKSGCNKPELLTLQRPRNSSDTHCNRWLLRSLPPGFCRNARSCHRRGEHGRSRHDEKLPAEWARRMLADERPVVLKPVCAVGTLNHAHCRCSR